MKYQAMVNSFVMTLAVMMALFTSGCASIVTKSTYPVQINSNPQGANFEVKNRSGRVIQVGITPATVQLDASNGYFEKAQYFIAYQKDGFRGSSVSVDAKLEPWYWGNIIFGGLIGMLIIDPLTGAMWKLPEYQSTTLAPEGAGIKTAAPAAGAKPAKSVAERLKEIKELKDSGIITDEEYETRRKALADQL